MKNRENTYRPARPQDQQIQRPQRDNAGDGSTKEPPMRFSDQDQELAADTIVRSDNPDAP